MDEPITKRRNPTIPTIDVRLVLDCDAGRVMRVGGNYLSLPGGQAFSGATLLQSAYLLAREQTGLELVAINSVHSPILIDSHPGSFIDHRITLIYHARAEGTVQRSDCSVFSTEFLNDLVTHGQEGIPSTPEWYATQDTTTKQSSGIPCIFENFIWDDPGAVNRSVLPIPTTDLVLNHGQNVLLIDRGHLPYGLALPGGHAEIGLTLEQNAKKEGEEETGLTVAVVQEPDPYVIRHGDSPPFCIMDDPNRDSREGQRISFAYLARAHGKLTPGPHDDAKEVRSYTVAEARALIERQKDGEQLFAFADHHLILERGLNRWQQIQQRRGK